MKFEVNISTVALKGGAQTINVGWTPKERWETLCTSQAHLVELQEELGCCRFWGAKLPTSMKFEASIPTVVLEG